MKYIFLFLLVSTSFLAQGQNNKTIQKVKVLLDTQTKCWNEGDIEGFMETYWKSDQLVFIGKDGPIYGWDATLTRYKKAYPSLEAMGQLKFDILEATQQSRKVISVIGKFNLTRPSVGDLSGYFILLIKKIKGKWLIIADHTS